MKTFIRLANNLRMYKKFNQYYIDIWLDAVLDIKPTLTQPHRAPQLDNKPYPSINS